MKEILEENGGFFMEFETFHEMEKALEETFASGAVVIIASMAKACGRKTCIKMTGKAEGLEETLSKFSELMSERNWGEFSFSEVDFRNGTGKILVKNSLETRKRKSMGRTCCYFLANFTAGFLSGLFGKNIAVTEKKCIGKGDEQCEFDFHPD